MPKQLKVADRFRTNYLSLVPGGKTVTVSYISGTDFVYDKVKSPGKYIKAISEKNPERGTIAKISVNGKVVWESGINKNKPWEI
jgi:hypothetical protein